MKFKKAHSLTSSMFLFLGITFTALLFFVGSLFLDKSNLSLGNKYQNQVKFEGDELNLPQLSIDKIFNNDHFLINDYPESKIRTILVTGDVLLARSVNSKTVALNDFNWPFLKVADVLREADVTYINLESPLINNCKSTHEGMRFCGDPQNTKGLVFAGVDVANIANNHIYDQGKEGAMQTEKILNSYGILPVGLSGSVVKDINGLKFGFLGYNDVDYLGKSIPIEDILVKEVNELKPRADVIIVQFHWGNEYTSNITDRQKILAHLAIDSGADLVIGNHPHWIQPIEIYKGKLIAYSHGNFIFDQEWSEQTKLGVVGKYIFYDDQLIDVEFLPIRIVDYGQPYFLTGEDKRKVLNSLYSETLLFQ